MSITFDQTGITFDEDYYDFDGDILWTATGPVGVAPNGTIEFEAGR